MTKKHFDAFAKAIKYEPWPIRSRMALKVAQVAEQFNPRFDRARFFKACDV